MAPWILVARAHSVSGSVQRKRAQEPGGFHHSRNGNADGRSRSPRPDRGDAVLSPVHSVLDDRRVSCRPLQQADGHDLHQVFRDGRDGSGQRGPGLAEPEPRDGCGLPGEYAGGAVWSLQVRTAARVAARARALVGEWRARAWNFSRGDRRRSFWGWPMSFMGARAGQESSFWGCLWSD
jgi:hypothetical protein